MAVTTPRPRPGKHLLLLALLALPCIANASGIDSVSFDRATAGGRRALSSAGLGGRSDVVSSPSNGGAGRALKQQQQQLMPLLGQNAGASTQQQQQAAGSTGSWSVVGSGASGATGVTGGGEAAAAPQQLERGSVAAQSGNNGGVSCVCLCVRLCV